MSAFGLAAAEAATRLDRAAPAWFAFGAVLGPIALLLLEAAPPGRCQACGTPSKAWLTMCLWCGENLIAKPPETMGPSLLLSTVARAQGWMASLDQAGPTRQIGHAPTVAPVSAPPPAVTYLEQPVPVETRILTTAIYVTGNTPLESGRRYIIAVHGPRLRFLGPADVDPSAIVLDRALVEMDATASDGRLGISGPGGRAGTTLIFMSVSGTTPDLVAKAIVDAARSAAPP
jgi:hypothetical protein